MANSVSRRNIGAKLLTALTVTTLGACQPANNSSSKIDEPATSDDPGSAVEIAIATAEGPAPADAPYAIDPLTSMTGRPLDEIQSAFDVRHYGISVRIKPASKSIDGEVAVTFKANSDLDRIALDLDQHLEARGATLGDHSLTVERKNDRIEILLPEKLPAGERATITVSYGGKPHIAAAPPWHGGFIWSQIDGAPWFATAVQTEGCDLWWPCKDHFGDKPDEGVDINVTAPSTVKVASNGVLAGSEPGEDGTTTWRWRSKHPYTGYAIAINGGPYELVKSDYHGVNGTTYPIEFWALAKNADKARALIESDAKPGLAFFERILGPYPWGDEKVGFVDTPHLGMEHQTINAYGEDYKRGKDGFDELLHHELTHEWFGNLLTHKEPMDSWLHEGYGLYMQAVYAGELVGDMAYKTRMMTAYISSENCRPVANADAKDISDAFDNRDIYTKGVWVLHTIRNQIGEKAFWDGTRELLYGTSEPWALPYPIEPRYRSTKDFIDIMSKHAGRDIGWIAEAYLFEATLPELLTERQGDNLRLSWKTPGNKPFAMPTPVSVDGVVTIVEMPGGEGFISAPDDAAIIIDPQNTILRQLPIIGDCADQTQAEIDHNKERYARMAREYGWQRE